MRRFWKSTEFYKSIALIGLFHAMAYRLLDLLTATLYFNAFIASYVLGRVLWKRNRGQFHGGALTSEFYFCFVAEAWNVYATLQGANPKWTLGLLLGMGALYNLARGVTKGIGVRTQTIIT